MSKEDFSINIEQEFKTEQEFKSRIGRIKEKLLEIEMFYQPKNSKEDPLPLSEVDRTNIPTNLEDFLCFMSSVMHKKYTEKGIVYNEAIITEDVQGVKQKIAQFAKTSDPKLEYRISVITSFPHSTLILFVIKNCEIYIFHFDPLIKNTMSDYSKIEYNSENVYYYDFKKLKYDLEDKINIQSGKGCGVYAIIYNKLAQNASLEYLIHMFKNSKSVADLPIFITKYVQQEKDLDKVFYDKSKLELKTSIYKGSKKKLSEFLEQNTVKVIIDESENEKKTVKYNYAIYNKAMKFYLEFLENASNVDTYNDVIKQYTNLSMVEKILKQSCKDKRTMDASVLK